jgi:hypothetical protein
MERLSEELISFPFEGDLYELILTEAVDSKFRYIIVTPKERNGLVYKYSVFHTSPVKFEDMKNDFIIMVHDALYKESFSKLRYTILNNCKAEPVTRW